MTNEFYSIIEKFNLLDEIESSGIDDMDIYDAFDTLVMAYQQARELNEEMELLLREYIS